MIPYELYSNCRLYYDIKNEMRMSPMLQRARGLEYVYNVGRAASIETLNA